MEMELDPRVKPLPYKVKAMSRETPTAKGSNVLELDLRTHWSSGTNTKEWILFELDEPCLLSNIRIYNKSVLEWEITVGLRYKPEAFVKVRPRCEALKRDMTYPTNYTPCRYVRLSCLRGNPIAVFFIQLIGISVKGLEPEFQPVLNYLLPHIVLHKQEALDMHLQLLQDLSGRLSVFLPQLEPELSTFADFSDYNIQFLAMLAGPFYPILQTVLERDSLRGSVFSPDLENSRNNQPTAITVSSNFEAHPRRLRNQSVLIQSGSYSVAFRSDAVILLLRKAFKDKPLGIVCRTAARALQKIIGPIISLEQFTHIDSALSSMPGETAATEMPFHVHNADFSKLFGEEFVVLNEDWDVGILNLLDIALVEEGILHVLYACALHPALCSKLAESNLEFWSVLPLIQSLLPALRPQVNSLEEVDESFGQWNHPFVEQALSQIVIMSTSSTYHPLLQACAGYLSSYCSSHTKAVCVLIDLCTGPFSPWIATITAKVDLAIELMEDLLGIIQLPQQSTSLDRAALKYILLGLSGYMDDVLTEYKEHKHKLLFLIEMLESFLEPAILFFNKSVPFGDVTDMFSEKQENNCSFSLNIIRAAVKRPTVLPSLESEWRRGSVASSVLLSIIGPNMSLPSDIDLFKSSAANVVEPRLSNDTLVSSVFPNVSISKFSNSSDADGKFDGSESAVRFGALEEASFLFAPPELKNSVLISFANHRVEDNLDACCEPISGEIKRENMKNWILMDHFQLDSGFYGEYFNLKADYLKLTNLHDCEVRATEFLHLAQDLCSQDKITEEAYETATDAFILAAECYINPFFMISFSPDSKLSEHLNRMKSVMNRRECIVELKKDFLKTAINLEVISHLERKRDKTVLKIILQAAKVKKEYRSRRSKPSPDDIEHNEQGINILPLDVKSFDAVTLLRKNQTLLFEFIIQQLGKEQHLSHEALLQTLIYLLQSATELLCPPEAVVDIVLLLAEHFCLHLTTLYRKLKDGTMQLGLEKLHGLERRWSLLKRLVIASSGNDNGLISRKITFGCQYRNLIPPSSWINKILKFSDASPCSRFLGWMAVSRYAKQYLIENSLFASDISQLRLLLSIFADELTLVDSTSQWNVEEPTSFKQSDTLAHLQLEIESTHSYALKQGDSFHASYPSLQFFFPNMRKQFGTFGEIILEAVGLQLKHLPSSAIPEILCWFSDLCLHPFTLAKEIQHLTSARSFDCLKGYTARNAKVIVLYLLKCLVTEHMETMLPEMPKIAQILISLCKTSYCDVSFLDSILSLLRPLISFFLKKVTLDENLLADASSGLDFELSSFKELFDSIRLKREMKVGSEVDKFQGFLMIFILGTLFPDLSTKRRIDILQSLLQWADFTSSEPTSSFYNYLYAFKKVFDSCEMLLEHSLKLFGLVIPSESQQLVESNEKVSFHGNVDLSSAFSGCRVQIASAKATKDFPSTETIDGLSDQEIHYISNEEIKDFLESLEALVLKVIPEIEKSLKLHYKLANQLTVKLSRCFLLSCCLKSAGFSDSIINYNKGTITHYPSSCDFPDFWKNGLQSFTKTIIAVLESACWQTASAMLDYLFNLPHTVSLDGGIFNICSALKLFCLRAPMISWRLQIDKWLTCLFLRGVGNFEELEDLLIDLFGAMLSHAEPEQRAIALHHLGVMVGLYTYDGARMSSNAFHPNLCELESSLSFHVSTMPNLVSNTWDRVAALILSDPSTILRSRAMALLSAYVPFITRQQRQSFLISAGNILQGMGKLSPLMEDGHWTRLSVGLLASACLYSPAEDITLIPESIWRNLEQMETSKTGWLGNVEKRICSALSMLRTDLDGGKEALKEVLSCSSTEKQGDINFRSIRESILQVLPSLTSTQAYFDFFSKKSDKEAQELEEAEIELDLLQKDMAVQEVFGNSDDLICDKMDIQLQQIKDNIRSLERTKLKEEVAARMQKKHAMRCARQKFLEQVASREMELLQELDRERKNESEQEIMREMQLELERARTRELRFNLDIERERQAQKELQRELEQVESGVRSSRRDFSSNSSSRIREKYRERENVRAGVDGGPIRPGSTVQTQGLIASSTPTVVLSGSRSFSGQPPTILQSRDRAVDHNVSYDDSLEGSRDSGDGNSVDGSELASALEGFSGFGSAPRRGGKSRQVLERKEREGRREGKWERKHS